MSESNDDALNLGRVLELLDERIHPFAVYLFGSAARSQLREDSDIDLAYLTDRTVPPYEQYLISQEAAELIHREVDLVNLRNVETVFCAQIITHSRVLVNRDKQRVASFHIRTLKEYALLNEERALILQSIRDRGSLYA